MASGSTFNFGFPYPLLTDPVEVHSDMEALAGSIDTELLNFVTSDGTITLTNKTLTAPVINNATLNTPRMSSSFIADTNGNELIKFPAAVTSAVNEITISNAATLGSPTISASGADEDINIDLVPKGLGIVTINGSPLLTPDSSDSLFNKTLDPDSVVFAKNTLGSLDLTTTLNFQVANTTGFNGTIRAEFSGSDKTITLPNATGTLYITGGTDVSLADGGTNASLTAVNGGIVYSTASAMALSAAGSSGQILRSGGAGAPTWSTATFPSTATTTGTILRADGTNWSATTATYPTSTTANQILYSSANNTITGLSSANNGVLVTNGSGVPSISTTIPAVNITLAAGTTGTAPLTFTNGLLLTNVAAHTLEYQGTNLFFTGSTNYGRAAIPLTIYTSGAGTSLTAASESTLQNLFPSTNDTITLPVGTYYMQAVIHMTRGTTSTTSASAQFNILGSGGATGTFSGTVQSTIAAASTATQILLSGVNINTSNVVSASSTTNGGTYTITISGILRITGAGTIVPRYNLSANLSGATTATALAASNFMKLEYINSSGSAASTGAWA